MKNTSESKKSKLWGALPAAPYVLWMVAFIVIPLGMVVFFALTDSQGQFTLENIARGGEYMSVLLRSIKLAAIATVLCVLIAYPLAYILSRKQGFQKQTLFIMVMLPMWMNFLLRTFAWMTILENNGLINKFVGLFGIGPLHMINTQGAVILGMVYNYIPFMILPIYNALCKIDKDVIEAAHDLGASARVTFQKIIIPLSLPGVISGIIMVFIPSISEFVVADILGGSKVLLFGNVIDQEFNVANNWNLGSGLSIVLMIFIFISMAIMNRHASEEGDNMLW